VLEPPSSVELVTYPRFVPAPDGSRLLLSARLGESGSGNEHLWEYDATSGEWSTLGMYVNGVSVDENPYPHGLSYTPNGGRLHIAWCSRASPDATTNHDLYYLYSDDHGRTWKSSTDQLLSTTGSAPLSTSAVGARVWEIEQDRGLINQEHMTVDHAGGVHVLLSHLPDDEPSTSNFTNARAKSRYFHYYRSPAGTWTRHALDAAATANFRGKLAVSSSDNVYAILPNLRILGAASTSNFQDWSLLEPGVLGRFFSDPLIDASRLTMEDRLTVFYPEEASPNIFAIDYSIE